MRAYRADRLFDGERARRDGVLVLVDGSTIAGVETGRVELPDGIPVTDLPGCTVLPGLIDAHVHLVGDGGLDALTRVPGQTAAEREAVVSRALREHVRAGVTAVRDLGDHHWMVAGQAAAGPRDGEPRIVAAGPPITTPGGHCWSMGGEARGTAELTRAVRERAERRVGVVKLMVSGGSMTAGSDLLALQYEPPQVAHVVSAAHGLGLPVTAHAHSTESVRVCLAAGVDGIEHCTCMAERGVERPASLFRALAEAGTAVCPTLGRVPGSATSPQAAELAARTGWSVAARLAQVGDLAAAGVRVISGSDAGIHPGKPHGVLPWAIAELVEAGIDPIRVLASATAYAADACGLAEVTGRLRPRLAADLLIVEGDPTVRIADLVRIRRVVVRGREA
jgi:imidazolonepropionase-like amidohydrolase